MKTKRIGCLLLCIVLSLAACSPPDGGESGKEITSTVASTSSTTAKKEDSMSANINTSTVKTSKTGSSISVSKTPVNIDKTLPASTAEESVLLNENPDRGFRLEYTNFDIQWLSTSTDMVGDIQKQIEEQLVKCRAEKTTVAQVYMYLDGYHGKAIADKGIACIQKIFDLFREKKIKMLLRFAYQRDMGRGGETTAIILQHIDQLRDVVHRNKDMIYSLQAGFIGAWGEWHSENPKVDNAAIIQRIVDVLLPEGTYLMTRLPQFKNLVASSHAAYRRIGFNNDAFWGKKNASYCGSGGFDPGTSAWSQAINESPYCPQDGELFWNNQCEDLQEYCDGHKAILAFSELRYTTFSVLHSYLDDQTGARTSMGDWQKTAITKEWLNQNGIPYAPSWFVDKNGKAVERTVFDFVRDYLGYKLEAQRVTVTGESKAGSTIKITMPIKNYGFSAAFNLESGFAVLDENNNVVTTVKAGAPDTWYCTSPTDYNDRTILTHTVTASMKLPNKEGKYKLAFYLKNAIGSYARMGNSLEYTNGYTVLHEFTL